MSYSNLFPTTRHQHGGDALCQAAKLTEGHCFQVEVIASIRVESKSFIEAMAPYHTSQGWFRVSLDQLLSAWLDCMDLEESLSVPEIEREPEKETQPPSILTKREDTKTENTASHDENDENDGLPEDLR